MAFRLNALVTTSEDCEGNTAQWRRQAIVIMQVFFSMDLPTDFVVDVQALQKLVNYLLHTASHLTLKSVSDFLRNIITETTEMSPGQATYLLHQVLNHAKAIADSEKLQIPSLPEKELLQSLADNPALLSDPDEPSSKSGSIILSWFGTNLQSSGLISTTFQWVHKQCALNCGRFTPIV